MPTFAWTRKRGRQHQSGGATLTFDVYKISRGDIRHYGTFKENSASYVGDVPAVHEYIAKRNGWKLSRNHRIVRKDVKVKEM